MLSKLEYFCTVVCLSFPDSFDNKAFLSFLFMILAVLPIIHCLISQWLTNLDLEIYTQLLKAKTDVIPVPLQFCFVLFCFSSVVVCFLLFSFVLLNDNKLEYTSFQRELVLFYLVFSH